MTILFIFTLTIFAAFLIFLHHRKSALAFLLAAIASFILVGNGIIPKILLDQLQDPFDELPDPTWSKSNAIVLLGGGVLKQPAPDLFSPSIIAYSRINQAATLYNACKKNHATCKIIISGDDPLEVGKSEAEVYFKELKDLDVNPADIELEPKSNNTFMNAKFTSRLLKKQQFDKVVLVTSGYHLKRALLYFEHFGINAQPSLSDYLKGQITLIPSAYQFAYTDMALHEYLGIIRFNLYNFLGLNKENPTPGAL